MGKNQAVEAAILRAQALALGPGWTPLVTTQADGVTWPLVAEGHLNGQRALLMAFDLRDSDLPLLPAFPLFIAAAVENLTPRGLVELPREAALGEPLALRLAPGVQAARVIDPATRAEMPIGEVGEIVLAGPQVTTGYWNLPTATEEAFVALDGGTFFRTGDLGSVNADGYFTLADRLKRMINASGFKVWPAEVENLLYGHPAVQEACVIRTRDPYRGETVKAMVVLKPDHRGAVTPEEIIEWAKDHMSAFKYPRQVEFVETLPHSAAGKLMWRLVQDEQDAKDAPAEQA